MSASDFDVIYNLNLNDIRRQNNNTFISRQFYFILRTVEGKNVMLFQSIMLLLVKVNMFRLTTPILSEHSDTAG